MNKILLGFTALFAVTLFSACSADDSFLTDDEINQLDKETSSKFVGLNSLYGNFSEQLEYPDNVTNYAIIIRSKKEMEDYGLVGGEIVNDTTSYTITDDNTIIKNNIKPFDDPSRPTKLIDYYKDINWDKQSLVVLTCYNSSICRYIANLDGSIYHKKGKYYVVIKPLVQTYQICSQALYRDGAAFVVNTPNLKKKDLVIQINAKVSIMNPKTFKLEIQDISKPLEFK
ncbi:MAG: hypothetical protein K2M11_10955 [Paramuribaculum sp.]|nr:hypothetical protein [Paramuribaculum sp.]